MKSSNYISSMLTKEELRKKEILDEMVRKASTKKLEALKFEGSLAQQD